MGKCTFDRFSPEFIALVDTYRLLVKVNLGSDDMGMVLTFVDTSLQGIENFLGLTLGDPDVSDKDLGQWTGTLISKDITSVEIIEQWTAMTKQKSPQ